MGREGGAAELSSVSGGSSVTNVADKPIQKDVSGIAKLILSGARALYCLTHVSPDQSPSSQ